MTSFCAVFSSLNMGYRIRRRGWPSTAMWIAIEKPKREDKMTLPFIYMCMASGDYVPWTPTQLDVLSNDWEKLRGSVNVDEMLTAGS